MWGLFSKAFYIPEVRNTGIYLCSGRTTDRQDIETLQTTFGLASVEWIGIFVPHGSKPFAPFAGTRNHPEGRHNLTRAMDSKVICRVLLHIYCLEKQCCDSTCIF